MSNPGPPPSDRSVAGRLLVSPPEMLDPNFAFTVVLVLVHSDEGAFGVVLNRPTDTPVASVLSTWADATSPPAVVFHGGPVELNAVVGLAHADRRRAGTGWSPAFGPLGTVDLHLRPDDVGGLSEVRVYAGYSGWAAGQLDAELALGAWIVVPCLPDDVFTNDPSTLWERVLRRQGGSLAVVALAPPDPSLN